MAVRVPERIENDEQYNEVLARIVKGAETLDHPLTTPENRVKLMPLYDSLVEVARKYRTGGAAAFDLPSLKEETTNTPTEPEQAPETPPEPPKSKPDLSGWLD
ncbi:hypothetical protein ACFQ5D_09445 [Paenibacillus farraposensis]|uniref:Terminase small subunit n=1 Tax=Paenibacillus farraposensis TaxID=2807095 RepID=A0ABW4DEN6_9BACL|nr:hypothetical protein [Paenibacillus farraposensis]MCC3379857.1 hypothetical protein [Paenibacillus farraposensis]